MPRGAALRLKRQRAERHVDEAALRGVARERPASVGLLRAREKAQTSQRRRLGLPVRDLLCRRNRAHETTEPRSHFLAFSLPAFSLPAFSLSALAFSGLAFSGLAFSGLAFSGLAFGFFGNRKMFNAPFLNSAL